jgi:hypothetical protein
VVLLSLQIKKELLLLKLLKPKDKVLHKFSLLLILWLMILHQVTLVLMDGLFQLMKLSSKHLIQDLAVSSNHHKLLLVLKLDNKLLEVFTQVMKEQCA